jgi:hypothetical protein
MIMLESDHLKKIKEPPGAKEVSNQKLLNMLS